MRFTSNFAPQIHKKKSNNKKKILLKSFFVFILLLKNSNNIFKTSIFIKPLYIRKMVMLRAPYRYKLARLHLTVNRYISIVTLSIKTKKHFLFNEIITKKHSFEKLGSGFESIFLHQKSYTFAFKVNDKKNFSLTHFNVMFVKHYSI